MLEFTCAMARRTRMNARCAYCCQIAIAITSMGTTESATIASCTSSRNMKTTTTTRPMRSVSTFSMPVVSSSCITVTSEVRRDITRPTSSRS